MMDRLHDGKTFPFAWLDEIIEVTLNPRLTACELISSEQIMTVGRRLQREIADIQFLLRSTTFGMDSRDKIQITVEQFETEVLYLAELAEENLKAYSAGSPLYNLGKMIIDELAGLHLWIIRRYPAYTRQGGTPARNKTSRVSSAIYKVLCKLSVDQIGIILKAADETRLIVSRSLSMVFKAIVPHLETENKKELSWDSMRSSTYHPEESDKAAAIAALEKMIGKIKGY
jgi:hypothetical protein